MEKIPKIGLVTMIIIVILASALLYENSNHEAHTEGRLLGMIVYIDEYDGNFSILDLGLDPDSIDNITDETFKLLVNVNTTDGVKTTIANYTKVSNETMMVEWSVERAYIDINETQEGMWRFEVIWDINSTDPDITSLELLGQDNRLSGNVSVNKTTRVEVEVDSQYQHVCDVEYQGTGSAYLILPLNQTIEFFTQSLVS